MKYITSVLIDPWRDAERAKVFGAGMLGVFGICLLGLTLSYTIAGLDLMANMTYQILRMMLMGLVGVAFSFWLIARPFGRWLVLGFQGLGLGLFWVGSDYPVVCALGYMCVASPFWASYNTRFALQQSSHSNAREIALGQVMTMLAGSFGVWLGGFLLHKDHFELGLFSSIGLLMLATQMLFVPYKTVHVAREAFDLIRKRGPSSRMTLLAGMLGVFQDMCLPVWLRQSGLSALATGTVLALQPLLSFVFTPVIGNLAQKGAVRSIRVGGVIILVGWALMALTLSNPWLLAPTLGLLAVGFNLLETVETARWFKNRSSVGITARENLLALGRLPGFVLALPLAFAAPLLYPLGVMGVASLFMFAVVPRKKAARRGG